MWKVKITERAAEIFKTANLTEDDKLVIQQWLRLVISCGPGALTENPMTWADHPLHGIWEGYRASRFSYRGRIVL
jgi:hypothetical protein